MTSLPNSSDDNSLLYWQHFRELHPNSPEGFTRGSWAFLNAGDFLQAENLAIKGIFKFPDEISLYLAYAEASMKLQNYSAAFDRWMLVRVKFPDCPSGYSRGVWPSFFLDNFEDAELLATQGITKFPDDVGTHLVYAEIADKQSHYDEAVSRWSLLYKKFPLFLKGVIGYVKSLCKIGDFKRAKSVFLNSITNFADNNVSSIDISELYGLYNSICVHNCVYDTIISLGYNCEVSHRLKDFFSGKLDAYPFSWVYIPPTNYASSLQNIYSLAVFKENFYIKGAMFFFESGIGVHSKSTKTKLLLPDGQINFSEAVIALKEIVSRFEHMVLKLKKLNTSNSKLMFVLKYQFSTLQSFNTELTSIVMFLQSILPNPKIFLLVVIEEQYWLDQFSEINDIFGNEKFFIAIDTVTRFALPEKTDVDGDISGWLELLRYYSNNSFSNRLSRLS